jgi:hypothetical protein
MTDEKSMLTSSSLSWKKRLNCWTVIENGMKNSDERTATIPKFEFEHWAKMKEGGREEKEKQKQNITERRNLKIGNGNERSEKCE